MKSKNGLRSADRRSGRRFLILAAILVTAATPSSDATAATALVRWTASASPTAVGYRVYVRDGGAPYAGGPQWAGSPESADDDSVSALVPFRPAATGVNYFSVVAIAADGAESPLSGELSSGTAIACHHDHCTTKTACDFSAVPDGTACGDATACGADVCVAGACAPGAGQGCCPACAGADACVAEACGRGECPVEPGTSLAVESLRFRARATSVKLKGKGRIGGDHALDPTTTGAVVELRGADGAVLYAAAVAPESFTGTSGRVYRFTAARSESDPSWRGLRRLHVRKQRAGWLVTVQAETPELVSAFVEPTITWVVRLGGSCASRADVPCTQKSASATCRE